jgi:hypothetical protein
MRDAFSIFSSASLLYCALLFPAFGADMAFRLAEPPSADGATPGWIAADGEITADTAKALRGFIAANKGRLYSRSVVLLNSPGGSLFGGIALGEAIRDLGLGTRIGRSVPEQRHRYRYAENEAAGACLSACAFAFLGGKWRTAADRTLGVHQHYTSEMLSDPTAIQFTSGDISAQQIVAGILADYVVRMGVAARLLTKAAMTEPRSMYLFTTKEMEDYGATFDELKFSQWKFEPLRGGLIATSKAGNGDSATLFCRGDKLFRLQLEKAYYGDESGVDELISGATVDLFGIDIPTADITGKVSQGRVTLEFKLPPQLAAGKIERASGMFAGGATRQFFYAALPAKDFGLSAKLTSRNCI